MIDRRAETIPRRLPGSATEFLQPVAFGVPSRSGTLWAPNRRRDTGDGGQRALDLILASVLLVICAVPMLAIALAIKIDSSGPVLFRQFRIGRHRRSFALLKFRTMFHHRLAPDDCRQATRDDPRITRLGHILRRTSLDELPQIFNVLRGEMSIVGPRPHMAGTRAGGRLFEDIADRYADRHRVRPGMTGLAQVRGWRGETDTEEKLLRRLDCDLEYIANRSLLLDLSIIARTIVTVFRMRNAY